MKAHLKLKENDHNSQKKYYIRLHRSTYCKAFRPYKCLCNRSPFWVMWSHWPKFSLQIYFHFTLILLTFEQQYTTQTIAQLFLLLQSIILSRDRSMVERLLSIMRNLAYKESMLIQLASQYFSFVLRHLYQRKLEFKQSSRFFIVDIFSIPDIVSQSFFQALDFSRLNIQSILERFKPKYSFNLKPFFFYRRCYSIP